MIGKGVFFIEFLLLVCLTSIGCQKLTVEFVESVRNGSVPCDFSRKHEKVIDPHKLTLTWYNPDNYKGISYSMDVASKKLIQNDIFWTYPSLNIYVSGYGYSSKTPDSKMFRNSFLRIQRPIILIDYSAYSGFSDPGYIETCYNLYNVGQIISNFLIDMVHAGVNKDDIHLMGVSLGAQLVGYTARAFEHSHGMKVRRLTGLDPAGLCFDRASLDENVKKGDADFVDIYNFNRGEVGTSQILGDANFLVNGGGPKQRPCEDLEFVYLLSPADRTQCAHGITTAAYWQYSIEDKRSRLGAITCDNVDQAVREDCDGDDVNAGLRISSSTRGIFYILFDYSLAQTFTDAALDEMLFIVEKEY